jgi:hypothetical protein
VTRPLLPHERDRGFGDVDDAEEIGLNLCAELGEARILDRADIAIARIVDEHIELPEGVDSRLDGIARCTRIGHVEGDART